MSTNLKVDPLRLWGTLMETAEFGKTAKGGVRRLTLSEEDRKVREWFRGACEAIGLEVGVDELGNMFATRPGRNPNLKPIAFGSHLDTQPAGGKFDGILGVLAGLEVMRTLADANYVTEAPLTLVNWTNEEGARFAPAMMASAVYFGASDKQAALDTRDNDGVRFGDALEAIGFRGEEAVGARDFSAFFELHIEQGPILEANEEVIGVVTGAQGLYWCDIEVTGRDSHAGTTPMDMRRDALMGAAEIALAVERIALDHGPAGVGTVGEVHALPGSRNTVPGTVRLKADLRHPDKGALAAMQAAIKSAAAEIAARRGLEATVTDIWWKDPLAFDPAMVDIVQRATAATGLPYRRILSGAGHDACYAAERVPTAMIFVPCKDGISHNELEDATPEHCGAGAQVLLGAILERDAAADR